MPHVLRPGLIKRVNVQSVAHCKVYDIKISDHFGLLEEEVAAACGVQRAVGGLFSAMMGFTKAHASRANKQTDLTSFLNSVK